MNYNDFQTQEDERKVIDFQRIFFGSTLITFGAHHLAASIVVKEGSRLCDFWLWWARVSREGDAL